MTDIQIPELPSAVSIDDSDLFHIRQGATDKNIPFSVVKNTITADDVGAIPDTASIQTTLPITGGGVIASGLQIGINPATTTTVGSVKLSTDALTQSGVDGTTAVTPASLRTLTASTTRAGLIEMCTDAEASTGDDLTRCVNSKQLKDKFASIQDASTTQKGLIRVATTQEATDLSSDAVAMSPLKMNSAFSGSKTANGYMKLPNGWIVQWGRNTTSGDTTVSFPIAFPNECFGVQLQQNNTRQWNYGAETWVWNLTTTSFRMAVSGNQGGATSGRPLYWFAYGH